MYRWIGRTHGLDFMHKLDTVLVSIFVVFVRIIIVLFRKSNSVWMDWTLHGLDTVLVNIFVVFVRVLIVLFRKSNSVWMDWTYAWIGIMHGFGDSVGKYFCRVCLCINSIV